ncbi:MAG: radical SAM protein [Lachnospiraceae bacterium]|nr:radical SAM protein [Lachnospiraceae bacterium]
MNIAEKEIDTKDLITKSNLPASDYVINPYVGCPHACKYCYARFMKRFTGHTEEWGDFIDIKRCAKPINVKKLYHKSVFLSSVTDCYNPFEAKYQITRDVLKQLTQADCQITISTKSDLILRDIDVLKELKNLIVAVSVNTLDNGFQSDMDHAGSITRRIAALQELRKQGIYTVLFLSPIFPDITDFKEILEATSGFVCEYWFENLNLRGNYKQEILQYIAEKYPQYLNDYKEIYNNKNMEYWKQLSADIDSYCSQKEIRYTNYFYHSLLVAEKKKSNAREIRTS